LWKRENERMLYAANRRGTRTTQATLGKMRTVIDRTLHSTVALIRRRQDGRGRRRRGEVKKKD
jgi:hypothetical protein